MGQLFSIGMVLFFLPRFLAWLDGVHDEGDAVRWIMDQRLPFLMQMQALQSVGFKCMLLSGFVGALQSGRLLP